MRIPPLLFVKTVHQYGDRLRATNINGSMTVVTHDQMKQWARGQFFPKWVKGSELHKVFPAPPFVPPQRLIPADMLD